MYLLGFLLILPLYGDPFKSVFERVSNYSIEVQKVGVLAKMIFKSNNTSETVAFNEDDIREANFVNKGKVAKYYSKSLRDYVVYENVSSNLEGFVVTLHDLNKTLISCDTNIENNQSKTPIVIFIPNQDFCVNCIDKKVLSSLIASYTETALKNIDYYEIGVLKNSTKNYASTVGDDDIILQTLIIQNIDNNETSVLEELSKRIVNFGKFNAIAEKTASNITNVCNEKSNNSKVKLQTENLNLKSIDIVGLNNSAYKFSSTEHENSSASVPNILHDKSSLNTEKAHSKDMYKGTIQSANVTQFESKNPKNETKVDERNEVMTEDISKGRALILFDTILKLITAKPGSDLKLHKSIFKKNGHGNNTILKVYNKPLKKQNTFNDKVLSEPSRTTQLFKITFDSTVKPEKEDEFLEDFDIPNKNPELPKEQIRHAHITETVFKKIKNKTSPTKSKYTVSSKLEPMLSLSEIIRMTPPNSKQETDIKKEHQLIDRDTLLKIMASQKPYLIFQKTNDFNPKPKWNQEGLFAIINENEPKDKSITPDKNQTLPEEVQKFLFNNERLLDLHRKESKKNVLDYNYSELNNSHTPPQSDKQLQPALEIFTKDELLNYINGIEQNLSKILPEEVSKSTHSGRILKFYRRMSKWLPFDTQKRNDYNSKIESGSSINANFKDHTNTGVVAFNPFFGTEVENLVLENFILDGNANRTKDISLESDEGVLSR